MVGDAVQLVTSHDTLAVDDLLLDHVAIGGGRPVECPWIAAGLTYLVDAALGDAEIAQAQHGALEVFVGRAQSRHLALRVHGDDKVDLRQLNLRAVEPEQRLALMDVLAGLADEQVFDEAVRSQRDDCQKRLSS